MTTRVYTPGAIHRAVKAQLLAGVDISNHALPQMPVDKIVDIHKAAGLGLGLLQVIDDAAYFKSTGRRRSVLVYTTPEERAAWATAK